jgi:tetratricopeptide (TPR) repeat protein
MSKLKLLLIAFFCLLFPLLASAQDTTPVAPTMAIPSAYKLENVRFEPQRWNNCGPATVTNALSYFGYEDNQLRAAEWLKPNGEDKNVSPDQMVTFVNTQVPELDVYAKLRYGGNRDLIRLLIANNFPVIIEKGYDPEPERLGWMGHYLLIVGYNDQQGLYVTHDSYIGANTTYTYDYIDHMWKDFNYTYIILYPTTREAELNALLGTNADEMANIYHALDIARQQAAANNKDAFAWFNMGTNFLKLGKYSEAAVSYDQARNNGLPWRMLWYQFGPFKAYFEVGRYDDILSLVQVNLNNAEELEETYYWRGRVYAAQGKSSEAAAEFRRALNYNPNFEPAKNALATMG